MCDNFRLTVSGNVQQVLVTIAPAAGFETGDYDLYVYNDEGIQIASDASDGYESTIFEQGSAYYDVGVQPWLINPGSSYSGVAQPVRKRPVDTVRECLELVPENVAVPVLDSGQMIELSAARRDRCRAYQPGFG